MLVFLLAQVAGGVLLLIFGMQTDQPPITAFSLILMAVDVLAVLACSHILHYIRTDTVADFDSIRWWPGSIAIAAGILGAVATSILTEKVPVPDFLMQISQSMSHNTCGLFTLVIIGPIAEELLFREAIEGEMLRRNARPWTAIIVSSLTFSIIHFNLAQGLYAFPLAILFGIIYYKTGNIVLTAILHIINNGSAALQLRTFSNIADISYAELLGGQAQAYAITALCATLSLVLTMYFWNTYPANKIQQKKHHFEPNEP